MTVIPYEGSDDWVESHIMAARACLTRDAPPPAADDCTFCRFAASRSALLMEFLHAGEHRVADVAEREHLVDHRL